MKQLSFFPTPYLDETLYSVLCRYHDRCGVPAARQTSLSLWGLVYGKKLFLPDGIENIVARISPNVNLTAERFIEGTTIFPLLKPFLTQTKSEELISSLKLGNENTHNIIGFSRVFTLQHRYLRYCSKCIESDAQIYGEPYWHRIHQMPGTYICPIHNVVTTESNVALDDLRREYYPAIPKPNKPTKSFAPDIAEKLLTFAYDIAWLLQDGHKLGCSEHTTRLYDNWLRVKGYRDYNGNTSSKRLAQDIVVYYGSEFLILFDAYNSGACTWIKRILQHRQSFQHPLYHILLMRFLANSAANFFLGAQKQPPEYLPFGAPPYPCRNYLCEHHLKDVIEQIEIRKIHGTPYATFACSYCGFSYNRKGYLPKERQSTGQINIVAYGWKWEETVTALLTAGESPYKIARDCHCDVRTILTFGVDHGLLPPERRMERKPYIPVDSPQEKPDFNDQRTLYRKRWLDAIATIMPFPNQRN